MAAYTDSRTTFGRKLIDFSLVSETVAEIHAAHDIVRFDVDPPETAESDFKVILEHGAQNVG